MFTKLKSIKSSGGLNYFHISSKTPLSKFHKILENIKIAVNEQTEWKTGFDNSDIKNGLVDIFVCYTEDLLVSVLVIYKGMKKRYCNWNDPPGTGQDVPGNENCYLCTSIWVQELKRRQGIATKILDLAVKTLDIEQYSLGIGTQIEEDGQKLFGKYFPDRFIYGKPIRSISEWSIQIHE